MHKSELTFRSLEDPLTVIYLAIAKLKVVEHDWTNLVEILLLHVLELCQVQYVFGLEALFREKLE